MTGIASRMEKVRRLMDSPNPGEAAAARARYAEMQAKYGDAPRSAPACRQDVMEAVHRQQQQRQQWIDDLLDEAVEKIEAKGYALFELNGGWYITPADDIGRVIHEGHDADWLIACAEMLPLAADLPANA